MLGAVGAKKTPRLRGSRFGSQSRWALPVPEFDPREIKPGMDALSRLIPRSRRRRKRFNDVHPDQIQEIARGNRPAGPRGHLGVPDLRPTGHGQNNQPDAPDPARRRNASAPTRCWSLRSRAPPPRNWPAAICPISPDRVGTLHSHCWHALGGPEIAEANVDEWNRDNPSLPITPVKKQDKLDGEEIAMDDDSETEKGGDELLQQLSRYRGLMLPPRSCGTNTLRRLREAVDGIQAGERPARFHGSDRGLPARRGPGAEEPVGHFRGRGAGPQPDAVVAGPEVGRARATISSWPATTTRPSIHSRARRRRRFSIRTFPPTTRSS